MFEEILEVAMGTGELPPLFYCYCREAGEMARTVTKEVIRAGMTVGDNVKDMLSEVKEEASDVVAEVRAERQQNAKGKEHAGSHSHKSHE